MCALTFTPAGPHFAADHPDPDPADGGAPLRVRPAGTSAAADREITASYMGVAGVLGHEFAVDMVGLTRPSRQAATGGAYPPARSAAPRKPATATSSTAPAPPPGCAAEGDRHAGRSATSH